MPVPIAEIRGDERTLALRDIVDGQLRTRDGRRVGRAADLEAELREDGSLVVTAILVGPEAHAGRLGRRAWRLAHRFLRGRHDHALPVGELIEVGPTLELGGSTEDYELGSADRWIVDHVLRFIPGHGK
jgi:hypothetical protein